MNNIIDFPSGELLQLLNSILVRLDSKHKVNLQEEPQEDTAKRMCDCLSLLNYKNDFDV